ncbi:MAG TPA: MFS transporter, partial [Longimicrobiaceae bacterium]|nr:MFS transporter [Longimicrobiaceae bacterium]
MIPSTATAAETRPGQPLPHGTRSRFHGLRWLMVGMIFLVTVVNYVDRMTLSVLAPTIMDEFRMNNEAYSHVVGAFLIAYTISQSLAGRFIDRIGTRIGFMVMVGVWTVSSMLHAAARSVMELEIFRFMLGIGEGGNWPGAAKAVAEWFPVRERAFAMAIFNSGSSIGAVLAPPVIVWVALTFGWRYAFFIGASLSSVVMVLWFLFYRRPEHHPRLSAEERAHILSDGLDDEQPGDTQGPVVRRSWISLFRYRQVWAVVA